MASLPVSLPDIWCRSCTTGSEPEARTDAQRCVARMHERDAPTVVPALSVVIASVNGYRYIAQCLRSLTGQRGPERAEIIVVEDPRSIPALRAIGIRKAKGDIVVTTEDHCVFEPGWYDRIIEAHGTTSHAAIGGAVENGSRDRLVDWAAYICEYGKFMLPFEAGSVTDLPGPNVSYKREVLEKVCGDLLDERHAWE